MAGVVGSSYYVVKVGMGRELASGFVSGTGLKVYVHVKKVLLWLISCLKFWIYLWAR